MDEQTQTIYMVINALNRVTTVGEESMDRLLGSIQTLRKVAQELKQLGNQEADSNG